jgi:cobyrinic acid a,c-diamide synthase
MKPQIVIGAVASGSGKTTFTMGLLRALSDRGLHVQPFKCGPDYIDTQFHSLAAGRDSVNLDSWMASPAHLRHIYSHYGADADVCVTEGVMGLFDGYDRDKGSTAEIATLLDIPVLLLVNAHSMAYSIAPLIYGFSRFNPSVRVAGVVFNQVSSTSHFERLRESCEEVGVECFGYLPVTDGLTISSRHLGLTLEAEQQMNEVIARAADVVNRFVDVDRLMKAFSLDFTSVTDKIIPTQRGCLSIAVAHDAAFNFTYRVNIDRLAELGTLHFFSPLQNDDLPVADLVYLPGGYPELFLSRLRHRQRLMRSIRDYAESGGKILAECGGMMFLSRSLQMRENGTVCPMCGILPFDCTMAGAHLHLGYRRMTYGNLELRGHEFHYSSLLQPDLLPSVAQQFGAKGNRVNTSLYRYKNVFAGYTHLYWGETNILDLWRQ